MTFGVLYDFLSAFLLQGPGNAAVVQLLLDAGADVNARTASDATALHIAACSNSGDVIRALVKAGGNARDNRAYKGKLIGTLFPDPLVGCNLVLVSCQW